MDGHQYGYLAMIREELLQKIAIAAASSLQFRRSSAQLEALLRRWTKKTAPLMVLPRVLSVVFLSLFKGILSLWSIEDYTHAN
jgi:hypothetical protein